MRVDFSLLLVTLTALTGLVWLIDSLGKRCRFLDQVKAELDLPATVINGRAEEQAITVDGQVTRVQMLRQRAIDEGTRVLADWAPGCTEFEDQRPFDLGDFFWRGFFRHGLHEVHLMHDLYQKRFRGWGR